MQISSFTGTRLECAESSPSFPVILFPFPFALLCFFIKSSSLFTMIQEKLLYSAYWSSKDKIALLAVEYVYFRHIYPEKDFNLNSDGICTIRIEQLCTVCWSHCDCVWLNVFMTLIRSVCLCYHSTDQSSDALQVITEASPVQNKLQCSAVKSYMEQTRP